MLRSSWSEDNATSANYTESISPQGVLYIYNYSEKFSQVKSFAIWPQKNCNKVIRKPHPPIALHVKYQCVGVSPSFNFHVKVKLILLAFSNVGI